MPTGKAENPDGPGAQNTLGRILGTDGNYYLFKNDAPGELRSGDPVVFHLEEADVYIDGVSQPYKISVARLELDDQGTPCMTKEDWNINIKGTNKKFKKYWKEEWSKEDEAKVAKLGLKAGFKDPNDPNPYKSRLNKLEKLSDIRRINAKANK